MRFVGDPLVLVVAGRQRNILPIPGVVCRPLGGMGELGRVGGGDVDEVGAGFVSVNHPGSWDIPGMGNIWSRIHWSDPDSR